LIINQYEKAKNNRRSQRRLSSFIDIQMGKYFRKRNITEFETENKAKVVLDQIIAAWNKSVAN
jgi:hypothetical protein